MADIREQLRCLEEYATNQIEQCREEIGKQLKFVQQNVERHIRVAQALHAGLRPEERSDNLERLQFAPNQPDIDHN